MGPGRYSRPGLLRIWIFPPFRQLAENTMHTHIIIDNDLVLEAPKVTGLKTQREAVELALKTLIRLKEQAAIKDFRGKFSWEGEMATALEESQP